MEALKLKLSLHNPNTIQGGVKWKPKKLKSSVEN